METSIKTLPFALALGTTVAFAGPGSGGKESNTLVAGIY